MQNLEKWSLKKIWTLKKFILGQNKINCPHLAGGQKTPCPPQELEQGGHMPPKF